MRIARCIVPGVVYHVISRFVEGQWRLRDDEERARYLQLFGRAIRKSDWRSVAFALMSNHIHHGLVAGEAPIESLLKSVHAPFAKWINERQGRIGPVFAAPPAMWAVRPENVRHLIAYIHNNPVRAGVVAEAHDSAWTSFRAYSGTAPEWLSVDQGRAFCGGEPGSSEAFEPRGDTEVKLAGIHREARKRGAVELATPTLSPIEVPIVARPFARIRPRPLDIVAEAARVMGLGPLQVRSRSLNKRAAVARRVAIHSGVTLGLTASDMGAALGISRQAAARTASRRLESFDRAAVHVVVGVLTKFPPSSGKPAISQVMPQVGG